MNEKIKKSCALTGHRNLEKGFSYSRVRDVLIQIIDNGYDTFYCGMAIGFDAVCFDILLELKEYYDISLIACIPCPEQSKYFRSEDKKRYDRFIASADKKIIISPKYDHGCMMKRNKYMVDNSALIFAYLKKDSGGTKGTVEYAKKQGKPVMYY